MRDIDEGKIRMLDGSLLLVLHELLQKRRTTLVAKRLGLSQSAVSHALARLRVLFDDALFVRKPYGLEPTRYALELSPRIDAVLDAMRSALGQRAAFEPAVSTRSFRIAAPDHLTTLLAPILLRAFSSEAPRARFAFSQRLGQDALEALGQDEIDLALGRFATRAPSAVSVPLFDDRYCVVARKQNPRLRGKLTRALYEKLDHVQVSVSGDFRSLELEPAGEERVPRNTVAAVPRFLIAFAVVAQSNAVCVVPRRLARAHMASFGLAVHALPFKLEPIRMVAMQRAQADAGVAWLLETIKRIAPA
jgi:DNA-binding transcriptional LysR family regulator